MTRAGRGTSPSGASFSLTATRSRCGPSSARVANHVDARGMSPKTVLDVEIPDAGAVGNDHRPDLYFVLKKLNGDDGVALVVACHLLQACER